MGRISQDCGPHRRALLEVQAAAFSFFGKVLWSLCQCKAQCGRKMLYNGRRPRMAETARTLLFLEPVVYCCVPAKLRHSVASSLLSSCYVALGGSRIFVKSSYTRTHAGL